MTIIPFLEMKDVNDAACEPSATAVPWILTHTTSGLTASHTGDTILCNTCVTTCTDLKGSNNKLSQKRSLPLLKSPVSRSVTLTYERDTEEHIIKKIIATGSSKDRPPMTAAFLMCLCVQYSSACLHTSDLRRLLLLIASGVQRAVWVSSTKTPWALISWHNAG